ncbi:glycoside hydrolase family 2 protein [Marinilabilia rubra]|uniref:beta-galactosidase n=1 Tax=Marinilabilia rubra TaxID=2162893 RepID=A0A2U2B5F9_9BACT|nr:glycoside hydrolase family 2 TIM barrel-domain containing protein [Marinilabilia rubra]PWD98309.1 glycoside hydrolase family 2 [Marinilabilia rubra]
MNTKRRISYLLLLWVMLSVCKGQMTVVPNSSSVSPGTLDLTGEWHFHSSYMGFPAEVKAEAEDWSLIQVPGEWTMQGFQVKDGEAGTYSRTFTVPSTWKNSKIFLRCDAVFSKADLVINGKSVGSHTGPLVAFEKEVSSALKISKSNRITVSVTAETMADTLMSGTQYAAHQLGGILRKIYLYAVPELHLSDLSIETSLDEQYQDAELKLSANLQNDARINKAEVSLRLFDPDGESVKLPGNRKSIILNGKKQQDIQFSLPVNNPLKWDAEHPNLYKVEITLNSLGGSETIVKNVGFREIKVVGNQLFVNGVPVKLKGVNRHEVHPLRGRSLTPELWKQDAKIFKQGNVNYIRTSHYPPSKEFIEWCDSLGLYVELENPISWVGHHANKHWIENSPKESSFYDYFEEIASANLAFFKNHPSIILWSMANESMWTNNWSKLADFYAKEDPTRPTTFHDQAYGAFNNHGSKKMPVANIHYPGTSGPRVAEDFERPLLFGEYAHLNTYNRQEIKTDPGVRDAWGRGFRKMWENMYHSRGCVGGAIWSGIDDVFYLPDGRAVGYGEWGPIDGWRRRKPEYYHMKKSYSPVKIHSRQIPVPSQGEPIRLQVENRFDFTNLNECQIHWEIGKEKGISEMNLPPKKCGILSIHPQIEDMNGKILTLRFVSPQNIEVEACAIEIGDVKRDDFPFQKMTSSNLDVNEHNDQLTIKGQDFSWDFDLKSGIVSGAKVNGESVLNGGTELMMLELKTGPCNTEHSLEIPLHNSVCSGKKVKEVKWYQKNDSVKVSVKVNFYQAEGQINFSFTNNGQLLVDYQMTSKIEMNPRQWGLVFSVPRSSHKLQWYRRGLWSWYPENHIGRTNGTALPFGEKALHQEAYSKKPVNDWRFDAIELGTNDFRATRENVYWAALSNSNGRGITVLSNGEQAFRSFVNGSNNISFLVAGYSTGGGDLFFGGHYSDEREKLEEGSTFKSSVKLQLVKK